MRERSERVKSPGIHMKLNQFHATNFAWHFVLPGRPPVLWWILPGEGRDAVEINCENDTTTENKGSGVKYIYAKGCILMTVCVFYLT